MSGEWEDLEREAEERLEELEQEIPEEWGYLVRLAEGESFRGYWRGEDTDTTSQFGERPAYLLLDEDREPCWLRGGLTILDAAMGKAAPNPGDLIFIARGKDGPGAEGGRSYRFVVRTKETPKAELPSTGPGELPEDY